MKIPGSEKPRTGWLGKDGTWKNSSGVIYPTAWSFYKKKEADPVDWNDTAQEVDNVNHPKHYTSDPSGVECIEITRHRNFNVGNAIKYLWRAGLKDDAALGHKAKQIEDLQKAIFYIEDEIKRLQA